MLFLILSSLSHVINFEFKHSELRYNNFVQVHQRSLKIIVFLAEVIIVLWNGEILHVDRHYRNITEHHYDVTSRF